MLPAWHRAAICQQARAVEPGVHRPVDTGGKSRWEESLQVTTEKPPSVEFPKGSPRSGGLSGGPLAGPCCPGFAVQGQDPLMERRSRKVWSGMEFRWSGRISQAAT